MRINEFVTDNKIFDRMDTKLNSAKEETKESFIDTLKSSLDKVNDSQINSEELTQHFIKGDDVDVHEVMLSTEEAKLSLQTAVQIRNKLVEAYQELNRMQL